MKKYFIIIIGLIILSLNINVYAKDYVYTINKLFEVKKRAYNKPLILFKRISSSIPEKSTGMLGVKSNEGKVSEHR